MGFVRLSLLMLASLAALATGGILLMRSTDKPEDHQVLVIIPEGASRREAAGQPGVELPRAITLTVGLRDTLIIRNDDGFVARVGPFRVEPGQQFTQRFRRAGNVTLLCTTLYHQEDLRIVVVDRRNPFQRLVDELVRQ